MNSTRPRPLTRPPKPDRHSRGRAFGPAVSVIVLALLASGLTASVAFAQGTTTAQPTAKPAPADRATHTDPAKVDLGRPAANPPQAPVGQPASPTSTGLPLRQDKPLSFAPDSPASGWWWKLPLVVIIIGGAWWYLKRRGFLKQPRDSHRMLILARTTISGRIELLIVDVDGQKLLIGSTPNSIQRIAVLPEVEERILVKAADEDELMDEELEPGFDRAMDNAQRRLGLYANKAATKKRASHSERPRTRETGRSRDSQRGRPRRASADSEGQAESLLKIGRKVRKI